MSEMPWWPIAMIGRSKAAPNIVDAAANIDQVNAEIAADVAGATPNVDQPTPRLQSTSTTSQRKTSTSFRRERRDDQSGLVRRDLLGGGAVLSAAGLDLIDQISPIAISISALGDREGVGASCRLHPDSVTPPTSSSNFATTARLPAAGNSKEFTGA